MTDRRQIEQALRDVRLHIPSQVDEKILTDASRALNEAFAEATIDLAGRSPESVSKPSVSCIGRARILRGPWRKAVAVGVPVAAAMLGLLFFDAMSPITLADVRAAVAEKAWVHVTYDNGREKWTSLRGGGFFYRQESGFVQALDRVRGLRQHYYGPPFDSYIYENRIEPSPVSTTPWDAVLSHYERAIDGDSNSDDVERHVVQLDGRRLVRFDRYVTDVLGRRVLKDQIWADPKSRLPVQIRHRLQPGERKATSREWITGQYEFPQTGPADLYDLGVPRDAEILRQEDSSITPEVCATSEAVRRAREDFPSRYRAVIWPVEKSGSATIIYRDGAKTRLKSYNIMPAGDSRFRHAHLPLPASAAEVLQWARTREPVNQWLYDGKISYFRWRPFFEDPSPATVQIYRDRDSMWPEQYPLWYQWPCPFESNVEPLADAPDLPPGCIALRVSAFATQRDYYLDPRHDHICVKRIEWRRESGQWRKQKATALSDFALLPSGHWYATKRAAITFQGPSDDGTTKGPAELIDITLLKEDQFPADVFDGGKLLEGANVLDY